MSLRRRPLAMLPAWAAAAFCSAAACSFPDYVVVPPGSGGAGAGASGSPAGAAGTSFNGGSNANGGGGGGNNGGGGSSQAGVAGVTSAGGDDGTGGDGSAVVGPCGPRAYPTHCGNHRHDVDETDVDCGGADCVACAGDEACSKDGDCATGSCQSNKCVRLLSLKYQQAQSANSTARLAYNTLVTYIGSTPITLRDVSVRYYFSRNAVGEPIVPEGHAFHQPTGKDISSNTQWSIVRQLRGDGTTSDAYLEITFSSNELLGTNDWLDLQANAIGRDAVFLQNTHYSFEATAEYHESKKLAVFFKGRRVWGNGPVIDDPPECFFQGVNVGGDALTLGSDAWQASPSGSTLASYANQTLPLYPATDQEHEAMLRSGFFFHNNSLTYSVESGTYAVVVYAWSADGTEKGTLKLQDQAVDNFFATSHAGAGWWVPLGPYRVSVDRGQLKVGAAGDLRIGGIELRALDE